MKLKEKFAEIIICTEIEGCSKQSDDCVKISNIHAINFAKWIDLNYICYNGIYNKRTDPYWNSNNKRVEELLEIFHKEKYN